MSQMDRFLAPNTWEKGSWEIKLSKEESSLDHLAGTANVLWLKGRAAIPINHRSTLLHW